MCFSPFPLDCIYKHLHKDKVLYLGNTGLLLLLFLMIMACGAPNWSILGAGRGSQVEWTSPSVPLRKGCVTPSGAKGEVDETPRLPLQSCSPSSVAPGCLQPAHLQPGAEAQPCGGVKDAPPWKILTEAGFLNLQPKACVSSLWFCTRIFPSPMCR